MENPFEQDRYFRRLAELLGVSVATLEASVGRSGRGLRRGRPTPAVSASPFRQAEGDPLEEHALSLLVHYPELIPEASGLSVEYLRRHENRAVLSALQQNGTIEGAYAQLDDYLADYLDHLASRALPPANRSQRLADVNACIRRLEERHLRELKVQEAVVLAQAPDGPFQDPEGLDTIREQITSVNQRLKELFIIGSETPKG